MGNEGASASQQYYTPQAGLCALGAKPEAMHFFEPVESQVRICQKTIRHRPTDKRKDGFIGLLSGVSGLYLIDKVVQTDPAVQLAFGRQGCAQQATVQDTLSACRAENITQLRGALQMIFRQHSGVCHPDRKHQVLILDLDLSDERTSKRSERNPSKNRMRCNFSNTSDCYKL